MFISWVLWAAGIFRLRPSRFSGINLWFSHVTEGVIHETIYLHNRLAEISLGKVMPERVGTVGYIFVLGFWIPLGLWLLYAYV